ncbi:MAG: glycosyltransferase family 4 protein [Polaromonas sp.]|nr:glycosyltransferase family 4 protein [Polaromonas sp.]
MSPPASSSVQRKLRIAVFNRTFSSTGGGAERYSIALVEQLAARHDMHVFSQEIEHAWPGVTYHKVSAPFRKPRWINQLWFSTATWWATRRGFDVVHSHENTWHGDVQTVHVLPVKYNLFRARTGWRLMSRWIKVVTSPRLLVYLGLERLRYAASHGLQVVVTSESLRSIMASTYPGCREMVSVITPGITMPELPVTKLRRSRAREQLGLPTAGACLLFVANDYRKKGLEILLQALAQLPSDVMLAVVGNSSHISEFRAQAEALRLAERVFFLGPLKDVGLAYEASNCLVHPTLEDTFAMVVLEAMAHGLPVVVSGLKYCGISGLLTHGVNALILDDPKDVSHLTHVLEQLLGHQALQDQLVRGAIDFAENYQWREIALKQEAIYFSVVEAKNAASAL